MFQIVSIFLTATSTIIETYICLTKKQNRKEKKTIKSNISLSNWSSVITCTCWIYLLQYLLTYFHVQGSARLHNLYQVSNNIHTHNHPISKHRFFTFFFRKLDKCETNDNDDTKHSLTFFCRCHLKLWLGMIKEVQINAGVEKNFGRLISKSVALIVPTPPPPIWILGAVSLAIVDEISYEISYEISCNFMKFTPQPKTMKFPIPICK